MISLHSIDFLFKFLVNLAEIIHGVGISWTAPILPKLYDIKQTPLPYIITPSQGSWIASSMYFGLVGKSIKL